MLVDAFRRIVDARVIVFRSIKDCGLALECIRVLRIGQIALAELLRDHACLHDGAVEQIALQVYEASLLHQRIGSRADDVPVQVLGPGAVFPYRLAVDRYGVGRRQKPGPYNFGNDGRHAAGAVVGLTEIFAGRLQIDQQRYLVADVLPVVIVERHAEMTRNGVQMDRSIGGAADRGGDDYGALEGLTGHYVGWLEVFVYHLDYTAPRFVRNLPALAIGRGNGGRSGQLHAKRLREAVHGRGRAHGVAIAGRWCG